ncbi:acyltransferase family protein [Pseudomonas sp. NPDC087342]|uniref:acyltransferase family protein n=1 Tax=Pseudomonas sp. NPDC087342 TaxID=3364437 RepID=UPI0037F75219
MHATVKLDSLTSLRFFAAAMIVLGHTHGAFGSFGLATTLSLAQGVSFFFVLSGFILAYNYPSLSTAAEIGGFLKARIARIWPAHIAAIVLLYLLTSSLNLGALSHLQAGFTALANLFLIQSLIPLRDVFLTFNGVAWSISTEMFFYLTFPLLITSIIPGWKAKLLFISFIVALFLGFSIAWNIPADDASSQVSMMGLLYVNPLVRLLEFFAGILACGAYQKIRANADGKPTSLFSVVECLTVALAIGAMWLTPKLTTFLGMHGVIGTALNYYLIKSGSFVFFALLIVAFALGKGILSRALSNPLLVLLGEISFSLYLVHMTLFQWYVANEPYFSNIPLYIRGPAFWLLALGTAFLMQRAIENPCRKLILSINKTSISKGLASAYPGKAIGYMLVAVSLIVMLKTLPPMFAPHGCQSEQCNYLVKNFTLSKSPQFGDSVRLIAATSRKATSGSSNIELAFKLLQPLPKGYILAVHLLDKNSEIIDKSDTYFSKSSSLRAGDEWVEVATLGGKSGNSQPEKLGLAIYLDPSLPMSVESPVSDYNGRRVILDLSSIQSN